MKKLFGVLSVICVVSSASVFAQTGYKGAYVVDDIGPAGGRIFYVDGVGDKKMLPGTKRYLEAASYDAIEKSVWSNITNTPILVKPTAKGSNPQTLVAGTSKAIGAGQTNTKNIIFQNGHKDSAAKRCVGFDQGNFHDWFLPSKDELDLIYNVLKVDCCIDDFSDVYWSSSEYSSELSNFNSNSAWSRIFSESGVEGVISWGDFDKKNTNAVRCIRSF